MSLARYDFCKYCGDELPKVKAKRYRFFMCHECHLSKLDGNYKLKEIYDKFIDNPLPPSPDEMVFEDEPNVEEDKAFYKRKGHTHLETKTIIDDI